MYVPFLCCYICDSVTQQGRITLFCFSRCYPFFPRDFHSTGAPWYQHLKFLVIEVLVILVGMWWYFSNLSFFWYANWENPWVNSVIWTYKLQWLFYVCFIFMQNIVWNEVNSENFDVGIKTNKNNTMNLAWHWEREV